MNSLTSSKRSYTDLLAETLELAYGSFESSSSFRELPFSWAARFVHPRS